MSGLMLLVPGQPPRFLARGGDPVSLGRIPDQDVVLDDPLVSRTHARLFWSEERLFVQDLESKHGTFVNGTRIRSAHPLSAGDELVLGSASLRLSGTLGMETGSAEQTLALPVEKLRGWARSGEDRFPDWREALDLLYGVSLLMLRDTSVEAFLQELLDRLFPFLDASRGAVLLRDPSGALAILHFRTRENASGAPLSLPPATVKAALERGEAVLLKEPCTHPGGEPAERVTSTVMAVPLEHSGEIFGLFYFDASRARLPFTEEDLRFAASLGNLAAARILQLRVIAELRRKEDLERELEAAEAAARTKSAFLALMSHEIRTPMNAILGFTRVALKETQTPGATECLRKIDRACRSLVAILDSVLDVSKLEAGKLTVESIPFHPRQVAEDALDLFRQRAEEKGIELKLSFAEDLPERVVGDPLRLGQVLVNLVSNAVKFTDRGRVELREEVSDRTACRVRLRFLVEDTGIGLAPEAIAGLFTDFTQADASTARKYGGTGLGLSISKRLVELMGGSIQVAESAVGEGTTFLVEIWFPVASPEEAPVPGPQRGPKPSSLSGRRILLVDDDALNRELARLLLEDEGAHVEEARDGREALEKASGGAYDAILMDVEMPGLDGRETTRRLRAGGVKVPILAMTAHVLAAQREECLAAGMDACLPKPIEPETLCRSLAARSGAGAAFAGLEAVMDVSDALERLNGREDLLRRFLESLLADPAWPDAIHRAMEAGDRKTAFLKAHSLKGMAGTLGLREVARAAADLEALLYDGEEKEDWRLSWTSVATAMERFRRTARETWIRHENAPVDSSR